VIYYLHDSDSLSQEASEQVLGAIPWYFVGKRLGHADATVGTLLKPRSFSIEKASFEIPTNNKSRRHRCINALGAEAGRRIIPCTISDQLQAHEWQTAHPKLSLVS
jgi:hypothetical protein